MNGLAIFLLFAAVALGQTLAPGYWRIVHELESKPPSRELASTLNALSAAYFDQRDYVRAERLSRRALQAERSMVPARDAEIARNLGNVAAALTAQGKSREARPFLDEAYAIFEQLGPRYAADAAFALNTLGTLAIRSHRFREAEAYFLRATDIWMSLAPRSANAAGGLANLAFVYSLTGRHQDSILVFDSALRIASERLGRDHPLYGSMLYAYADCLIRANRTADGTRARSTAASIVEAARAASFATVDASELR